MDNILKYTRNATQFAVSRIISDIIDITVRFQPERLEEVSEALLNETQGNLVLTEIALKRAYHLAQETEWSFPDGAWMLIYAYAAIWGFVFLIIIYTCMLRRATHKTEHMYKQMQVGRKDVDDPESKGLMDDDSSSMNSGSISIGSDDNESAASKAWRIAYKSRDKKPSNAHPLELLSSLIRD